VYASLELGANNLSADYADFIRQLRRNLFRAQQGH
jgi:hypothetical protein